MKDYFRGETADRLFKGLGVAEEQEITLDDVLKYCKAHRLIVISEELFYRLNHMAKIPNRTEEQ